VVDFPSRVPVPWRQFDYLLFVVLLVTTALGLVTLDGSTYQVAGLEDYTRRQAVWCGVSIAIFAVAAIVPYGWLRVLGWPLYILSILSLLLFLFFKSKSIGFVEVVSAGGAASWLRISLGGHVLRVQPSEFAKITAVVVLAHWLALRQGKLRSIWECAIPFALAALPMALIFKQPDFGTAVVFLPMVLVVLFVAGLDWRVVLWGVAAGCVIAAAGIYYVMTAEDVPGLRAYQQERLRTFLGPLVRPFRPPGVEEVLYGEEAEGSPRGAAQAPLPPPPPGRKKSGGDDWNIRQAEMALGSGQVAGKGWRRGTQSRLKFLPQHYTDFIFSSLGEQFGLTGCLTLILLYLLLVWRAIAIAVATADPFGKYLVVGLLSVFVTHIYLNVGMSVRLLPVTGLPLPLMSYGGSFLAANYLLFGLIANVGMRRAAPR
jgi:rod shape determining protein RodA